MKKIWIESILIELTGFDFIYKKKQNNAEHSIFLVIQKDMDGEVV